jgi:hypothetical protein
LVFKTLARRKFINFSYGLNFDDSHKVEIHWSRQVVAFVGGKMSFIEDNLDKLNLFLTKDVQKALDQSSRSAMGRAGTTMRKEASKVLRSHVAIKAAEAKRSFFLDTKVRGNLWKHSATLKISSIPLPLIGFLVGPKKKTNQKGIAVKSRKAIRVRIRPGKKNIKIRTGFIRDSTKGSGLQIFKRKGKEGWAKQTVPSQHRIFNKMQTRRPILKKAVDTYETRFQHEFNIRVTKLGQAA